MGATEHPQAAAGGVLIAQWLSKVLSTLHANHASQHRWQQHCLLKIQHHASKLLCVTVQRGPAVGSALLYSLHRRVQCSCAAAH